ncbi:MAG: hypothetical protein ACLQDL_16125 [Spirochaetia bacterium]
MISLIFLIAPLLSAPAAPLDILPSPLTASLEQVLDAHPAAWREASLEVYRWDLFPDILIVDTARFAVQDRMFTRLAYFLEKRGWRGKLLGNAVLAGRHGWNAHDYGPEGLAVFFSTAAGIDFPLNPEEVALRQLALSQGIILRGRGRFAPGAGGVLSISRSSSAIERRLLLAHESFHGVFFSSAEYRSFCLQLWDSLPRAEKSFYTSFLDSLGYDTAAPTLVVNEFQAYLMQQPLKYAASYFERFTQLWAEVGSPLGVEPSQLVENARALDAFLRPRFGFGAGGPLLAGLGADTGR